MATKGKRKKKFFVAEIFFRDNTEHVDSALQNANESTYLMKWNRQLRGAKSAALQTRSTLRNFEDRVRAPDSKFFLAEISGLQKKNMVFFYKDD
jgi:hypothetical protein